LFAAESKAKEARKGLWHDWDPSQDAEEEGEEAPAGGPASAEVAERRKDYRDLMVTNVDESVKLKVQQVGPGTAALTELMESFRKFHLNNANNVPLSGPPKAGDYVAARFTEDNEWYRARIRRNDREAKHADVVYVDYGNSESNFPCSRSSLRPWMPSSLSSNSQLRPNTSPTPFALLASGRLIAS
jgi:staphylococcal nuclease domain-containing protein 1